MATPEEWAKFHAGEDSCLYCGRHRFTSPGRLRRHVLTQHPNTYRAVAYARDDGQEFVFTDED